MGMLATTWRFVAGLFKRRPPEPQSRTRNLRPYFAGVSPGSWASDHFQESLHSTGWTFCATRSLAKQFAQATLGVYRVGQPPQERRFLRSLRKRCKSASKLEGRLAQAARELNAEHYLDGYGACFYHPDTDAVWFVTCDGTTTTEARDIRERLEALAGVGDVTLESEAPPPKGAGWVRLHPAAKAWTRRRDKASGGTEERQADEDRKPVGDGDPLLMMLRKPNKWQSGALFRFQCAQQLELTGTILVWATRNAAGTPVALYVVPTGLARPMPPTASYPAGSWMVTPLASYGGNPEDVAPPAGDDDGYAPGGAIGSLLVTGGVLDGRDVKAVRWPHPIYLSDGLSPLAACSVEIDVAEQLGRSRWASLHNSSRPGMVFSLSPEANPSPEDQEAFREDLKARNAGTQNTGNSLVLPQGMTADQVERSATELDYAGTWPQARDSVLAAHQTPAVAAGIAEAGSYSAFWASLKQYVELAVQPALDMVADELGEWLGPQFARRGLRAQEGDWRRPHGYVVEFKARAIDDPTVLETRLKTDILAKAMTTEQYCRLRGYPVPDWGACPIGVDPLAWQQQREAKANPPPDPALAPGAPWKPPPLKEDKPSSDAGTGVNNPTKEAVPGRPDAGGGTKSAGPHKFASTHFELPADLAGAVLNMGKSIPAGFLAGDGVEDEPHVTCLYGLHDDAPEGVRAVLADYAPVAVRLGRTSLFPASPGREYDVLKVDVESPGLHRLHAALAALPHTDTHADYHPHVTIGYLRPGVGALYDGDDRFEGRECLLDVLTFSARDGTRTHVRLTGTKSFDESKHPRGADGRFGGDAAGGTEDATPAADDVSPVRGRASRSIDSWVATVAADKQDAYRKSLSAVTAGMSDKALGDFLDNTTAVRFHDTLSGVTDAFRREGQWVRTGQLVGGFSVQEAMSTKSTLHLDGGGETGEAYHETAVQIAAHEATHALDPGNKLSGKAEWVRAWKAEVATTDLPLSKHGAKSAREGLAEMGRLCFTDPKAAAAFPRCLAFFRAEGLV